MAKVQWYCIYSIQGGNVELLDKLDATKFTRADADASAETYRKLSLPDATITVQEVLDDDAQAP